MKQERGCLLHRFFFLLRGCRSAFIVPLYCDHYVKVAEHALALSGTHCTERKFTGLFLPVLVARAVAYLGRFPDKTASSSDDTQAQFKFNSFQNSLYHREHTFRLCDTQLCKRLDGSLSSEEDNSKEKKCCTSPSAKD